MDQTTGAVHANRVAAEGDNGCTLVLKLGYRGTSFSGFAEQLGYRTVAGELRHALETLLRRPVDLTCAGRTDAGVHALSQFVSVPLEAAEASLDGNRLLRGLVALTPDDVSVRGVYRAPVDFSARFDARSRSYRYRIACGAVRPVLSWGHVWWLRQTAVLDVDAMDRAARHLIGEHDFCSFCKVSSAALIHAAGRSTCRHVSSLRVARLLEAGEEFVVIDVQANAFLHNMVRIIVGSLVEVGRGIRDGGWLAAALESRARSAAGPTAPACGLTFENVEYPAGMLIPWT